MGEIRYMISEASKQIDVEPHVLRNWEQELLLEIPRNEMGHRYFRESDIKLMKTVKHFKDQGFQLKAIKMLLPNLHKFDAMDEETMQKLKDKLNEKVYELEFKDEEERNVACETGIVPTDSDKMLEQNTEKMESFKVLMNNIITEAITSNHEQLANKVSNEVSANVLRQMKESFRRQEEKAEERYHRFDAVLRDTQKSRFYAAASFDSPKRKKKSKFFKKNKVYI